MSLKSICLLYPELTKQVSDKYDLPVKSTFSASRGFYLQLYCGSQATDKDSGRSSHGSVHVAMEDLPREFIKVTKQRNTFSFTTVDLIKLNSMLIDKYNKL